MKKVININQRFDFCLSSDIEEPKTVFVLRPLSGLEMLEMSSFVKDGQLCLNEKNVFSMLSKSIVEIKNFDTTNIEEAINSLDVSDITELIMEIGKINNITEADKKK
jgi:hypothetical protein